MPVFFNNCRGREHIKEYGDKAAFYDLNLDGRQATMATDIRPGDICIVATPDFSGNVTFKWHKLSATRILADKSGIRGRVFHGKCIRSITLRREEATSTEPYSIYFNVNGHFKRPSVIEPRRTLN